MLKDYDYIIIYHPGRANVVADALSCKSIRSLAHIAVKRRALVIEMQDVFSPRVFTDVVGPGALLAQFQVQSLLREEILVAQRPDPQVMKMI